MSLPSMFFLTRGRADDKMHPVSRLSIYVEEFSFQDNLNALFTKNPLHLQRHVDVLPTHEPRAGLDDCYVATEAPVSLGHFESNIAPTDHDQMRWHVVELQSLDMCERSSSIEAGNIWNRSMGSQVEEDFVRRQHTLPPVVQRHLKCFRRDKTPAPHDQFGAARFEVLPMPRNL